MKYLFFLMTATVLYSCFEKQKDNSAKIAMDKIDFKKTDSVIYYKDAIWSSFKGIHELHKDSLTFPFVAFIYNAEGVLYRACIVYNGSKIRNRYFKYKDSIRYIQSKYYNPELRTILYQYRIFNKDGSLITFNSEDSTIKDSMIVYTVYNEKDSTLVNHSAEYFFLGKGTCSLNDMLLFSKEKLTNDFRLYGEEALMIDDNKLYRVHRLHKKIELDIVSGDDKKVLFKKDLGHSSFFYFYNDEDLYHSIP